jgi:hypothetical protein
MLASNKDITLEPYYKRCILVGTNLERRHIKAVVYCILYTKEKPLVLKS